MVWRNDFNTVCYVEIDPFCQKVLRKHWPDVPIVEDIRDVETILQYANESRLHKCLPERKSIKSGVETKIKRTSQNKRTINTDNPTRTAIDLLTGGFPCQGFSVAGKRRGKEDDRYLWPEMFKVIQATRPRWVIGENVTGIINMALDTVLSDLEGEGYSIQTLIVPACAVDAPHRRDRVWIVANTKSYDVRCSQEGRWSPIKFRNCIRGNRNNWPIEPELGRVAYGIPNRVDRLKSLGNAIVPQVVVPIMEAIKIIENGSNPPLHGT